MGRVKTTWLRERFPDALFVNLLRPETYRELTARPERLRQLVPGAPGRRDVVVDEVQRVPELLNVVHDVIESPEERRFVLTGSSARKLRRGGIDLMAGRAVVRSLHPFMAAELERFDLDAALRTGMVPRVVAADDPVDTLSAYATLYLDQEVRAEGFARDVGQFARFLEAISFSQAAVLNVKLVAQHLRAWADYRDGSLRLFYWRTRGGVEVDFVLYGDEGIWALEVRNAGRVRREDLRALKAFAEDYPEAGTFLLYRGEDRLFVDGIPCVPVAEFLAGLRPTSALEEAAGA